MTGLVKQEGVLTARTTSGMRGADWVFDGVRHFRANWAQWLPASLFLTVLSLVLGLVPVLGHIALFLLMPLFTAGLMLGLKAADQGRGFRAADLFLAFRGPATGALMRIGAMSLLLNILAFVVMLLCVNRFADIQTLTRLAQNQDMLVAAQDLTYALGLLIGMLIYVGLLVPITMLVWFAPALVVLEGEQALASMRHSFVGCARNLVPYLVYGLVGLVLFPLALVLFTGILFALIQALGLHMGFGQISDEMAELLLAAIGGGLVLALLLVPVGLASIYAAYKDIFHRA